MDRNHEGQGRPKGRGRVRPVGELASSPTRIRLSVEEQPAEVMPTAQVAGTALGIARAVQRPAAPDAQPDDSVPSFRLEREGEFPNVDADARGSLPSRPNVESHAVAVQFPRRGSHGRGRLCGTAPS